MLDRRNVAPGTNCRFAYEHSNYYSKMGYNQPVAKECQVTTVFMSMYGKIATLQHTFLIALHKKYKLQSFQSCIWICVILIYVVFDQQMRIKKMVILSCFSVFSIMNHQSLWYQ